MKTTVCKQHKICKPGCPHSLFPRGSPCRTTAKPSAWQLCGKARPAQFTQLAAHTGQALQGHNNRLLLLQSHRFLFQIKHLNFTAQSLANRPLKDYLVLDVLLDLLLLSLEWDLLRLGLLDRLLLLDFEWDLLLDLLLDRLPKAHCSESWIHEMLIRFMLTVLQWKKQEKEYRKPSNQTSGFSASSPNALLAGK